MLRKVPSIRLKVMLIMLVTSFVALLFAGLVLVAYDVKSHQRSWARDLMIQADIVGGTCAPAIVFGDTLTAHQTLGRLSIRPEIRAAAVYTRDGLRFSSYQRPAGADGFPDQVGGDGARFVGSSLRVFEPIVDPDGRVGTVYLDAHYDLGGRLGNYLPVLAAVLLASLLVALLMSSALESQVTRPVRAIADVARQVESRGDLSLRVPKTTGDETGQLVDAFNAMLGEVQAAHAALLESNRRKDEFLATLAHELRNPLGPIRNAAQYLRLKDAHAESRTSLEIIDRQVQHMTRLIEDLLDVSRITRDALELRKSEFTVGDFVRDVVEANRYAVEDAGLTFQLNEENAGALVHADRARLVQITSNLLNNAIKYTLPGGTVELTVRAPHRDLTITVRDTGIGIPKEKLRDIFEPFSQLDRSLEKTRGGLGIGLALSERLASLHGGAIDAYSQGPGHGSTFIVTLPVIADTRATPPPSRDALPRADQARHILVADDNVDGAESLALLLRTLGHDVATAHDGLEALRCLEQRRFDVAILDIGMPGMNGYDLAREIRARDWGHDLLLVALTGWGQSEDKLHAYETGFDRHLTKPIQAEQLITALQTLDPGVRR
jgi:signal transduction histidine kinase/CheY-like chemotaxis protein